MTDTMALPNLSGAVRQARLNFAFGNQPTSLVASVMLAGLTFGVLVNGANTLILSLWFAVLAAVNGVRLLQYRQYRSERAREAVDLAKWERSLLLGCLVSGTTWGVSALLFLPGQSHLQFFLAFVIAGVSAGAVSSLSVALRPALAFVVPCVLPLALRFIAAGDGLHIVMGVMTLLYIGFAISVARRGDEQLTHMVTSQIDALLSNRALKTSEQNRQLTHERLRIATEAGNIGVWEWNLASGAMVWDKQVREIYRLQEGAERYDIWRQRVHPADIERVEALLNATIASGEDFNSELRILWPNGQERLIKVSATLVRDKQGRTVNMTGINLDITELKRVERMKSEFVSIVSHELRTPLTSIRGSLGLVANDAAGPVPDKVKQILLLADRNAERLGILIDDLLDIEKLEAGKLKFYLDPQPLAPLIKQSITANAPYATRNKVELISVGAPPTAVVAVDGLRLQQVMTNLLSNAIKFSPPGARVEIETFEDARHVRVEVRDRGPGIAPDFQAQIFGKFSQGDSSDIRAAGGAGLGLAISKAIVEQLNGTIGFTTDSRSGTTFFFELPLYSAAGASVQSTALNTTTV